MVQQDKAYLEQVAAAVTETQSILKDVEAAADELSGQSSIVYENSVNTEGFDVLDEYYTCLLYTSDCTRRCWKRWCTVLAGSCLNKRKAAEMRLFQDTIVSYI